MSFNVAMLEQMQAEGLDLAACIRVLKAGEKRSDPTAAARMAKMRAKRKSVTRNVTHEPPNDNTLTPGSEAKASSPPIWVRPDGVDEQVWADFLTNRKRKKRPNTASAWKDFQDDVARVSLKTGIPPPQLIAHAAAKGWAGIYDPTESRNERQSAGSRNQQAFDGAVGDDPYSPF